jgi:hypothetical protein
MLYELILTVVATFGHPVAVIDGHGVNMVSRQYEIAVQGFKTREACETYASATAYSDLEKSLTDTFGADTKVAAETAPRCQAQSATSSALTVANVN